MTRKEIMMGKKSSLRESRFRAKIKRRNKRIGIAVFIVLCFAVGLLVWYLINKPPYPVTKINISENGELVIPKSKLSSELTYIDYKVDKHLLARIDENGKVQTAVNTCQECYENSKAYFYIEGDNLVCSDCGATVPLSSMGEHSWGGHAPVSIPAEYRSDTETDVVIPYFYTLYYIDYVLSEWTNGNYDITMEQLSIDMAAAAQAEAEAAAGSTVEDVEAALDAANTDDSETNDESAE